MATAWLGGGDFTRHDGRQVGPLAEADHAVEWALRLHGVQHVVHRRLHPVVPVGRHGEGKLKRKRSTGKGDALENGPEGKETDRILPPSPR